MTTVWQEQEHDSFVASLQNTPLESYQSELSLLMQQGYEKLYCHGNSSCWYQAWQQQPKILTTSVDFNHDSVRIGEASALNTQQYDALKHALQALQPWRKGPFLLFGIHIDTEWHSDWKWQRIAKHIEPLAGRTVLDVGCGSGYHLWRMLGASAKLVVGIDPTMLFVMQFEAIKRYQRIAPAFFLPVGIEAMPQNMHAFDTVFSMGVLYHRRSPIDHLVQLRSLLRPKGELILETLYVDGDAGHCLLPSGRYAKMRNVWLIPSIEMLKIMLQRTGYHDIRVVHAGVTTTDEQRTTDWMPFKSLKDFLADADPNYTCEGYPAPRRVVILAKA